MFVSFNLKKCTK